MNKEIKQYNKQQIKYIETTIQDYLANKIPIDQLVNNLEISIYNMKKYPKKIITKLISLWGILEEFYAWMLDQNRTALTLQEQAKIKKVLIKINFLILQYKEKYLSNSEDHCN
ncbi:hypothetical protein ACFLYH_01900 [Candidatus Dependentiae bacterium]